MLARVVAASLGLAALLLPVRAAALPGIYVAKHGEPMTSGAATVVLLRDGQRTVVTVQAGYRGPADAFALVLPVPAEVRAEEVRIVDRRLLDRLDQVSAPALVEQWERDPCLARAEASGSRTRDEMGRMGKPRGRSDDDGPTYQDGEFSFMAPGAAESANIARFLREREYQLSLEAEAALQPYADAGMRFLIAEVDPQQVHFGKRGEAVLSPLRFHYDAPRLVLPLRLAAYSSPGGQDLVIQVIARQRVEPVGYPAPLMPTSVVLRAEAREKIGPVHAALFDAVLAHTPGAIVTEHAGSLARGLGRAQLDALGLEVAPGLASDPPGSGLVVTRLHTRLGADELVADLELREARPIVGGTDLHPAPGPAPAADPALDGVNEFATRYLIRHAWAGALGCADPLHGVWEGPPEGQEVETRRVRAMSDVERTLPLAQYLAQDLPELGVTAKRCGCELGAPIGSGSSMIGLLALRRRRRQPSTTGTAIGVRKNRLGA